MGNVLVAGAGFSVAMGLPLTGQLDDRIRRLFELVPTKDKESTTLAQLEEQWPLLTSHGFRERFSDYEERMTILREASLNHKKGWATGLGLDESMNNLEPRLAYEMYIYCMMWALEIEPSLYFEAWGKYHKFIKENEIEAIITTNYDTVPERIVAPPENWIAGGVPIDYGFEDARWLLVDSVGRHEAGERIGINIPRIDASASRFVKESIPILKIHGSRNMAYCGECKQVLVYPPRVPAGGEVPYEHGETLAWAKTTGFNTSFHCGAPGQQPPNRSPSKIKSLVVPPVKQKEFFEEWPLLDSVRTRATDAVREANQVFVVGSGVRKSDDALRQVISAGAGKDMVYVGGDEGLANLRKLGFDPKTRGLVF